MYSSKVALMCPKCKKGVRYGVKLNEDGKKIRICRHCGAELE